MLAKNAAESSLVCTQVITKKSNSYDQPIQKTGIHNLLKYLVHQKLQLQLRLISHPK